MKFIASFILTALLSFSVCLYFPWWSIAVVGFVVAIVIPQKPGISFLVSFLSLFMLWGGLCLYISNNNDHLLAHKVSLIILKVDSPYLLIFATSLIGALVAGFSALSGSYVRKKNR